MIGARELHYSKYDHYGAQHRNEHGVRLLGAVRIWPCRCDCPDSKSCNPPSDSDLALTSELLTWPLTCTKIRCADLPRVAGCPALRWVIRDPGEPTDRPGSAEVGARMNQRVEEVEEQRLDP